MKARLVRQTGFSDMSGVVGIPLPDILCLWELLQYDFPDN
jgi:hypothetical protein